MSWEMLSAIGQLTAVLIGIPSLIYLAILVFASRAAGHGMRAVPAMRPQSAAQFLFPRCSSSCVVESSSSIRAAAVFSSRCLTFEVPGIGSITGDFRSNHASAICAGCTFRCFAARVSGPACFASSPVASGNQGMKPMFSPVQYSSTPSEFLSTRLYRFCTETIDVDIANLALVLKIGQRADLIFHRYFRIDPVEL